MVEIIAGKKGKGKTKYLLDKVNTSVENASGNIVYLDKSQKHMHELSNKVRLINVGDYQSATVMNSLDLFVVLFHRIMICRKCILTVSLQLQTLQMISWCMQLRNSISSVRNSMLNLF